jgi:type IV pilus assembly protein PilC
MNKTEQKPKTKSKSKLSSWKNISFGRMSIKDQTFFIKRLSFLIKAGIPILESLHLLREQTKKKSYGRILDSVIEDVSNGQYLSTSLGKFRNTFGDFSINLISFGESSGILSENLEYLAEELRKKHALKKKIISAFIYPAIVTLATIGITAFLMIYLFPKIMPIFTSIHMELPLSTRIVMAMSNFTRSYGLLTVGVLFLILVALFIFLKKSKKFHYYFDMYLIKMPILGQIIQQYNLANSTRTMGLLLKSGITVSEALPIVAKTTVNMVYQKEFQNLSITISRGEKISTYLKIRRRLFPDVVSQIISVGERSGSLSSSLIYLSDMYENEVDDFTKNLSNLIEPLLMIFMGVMVGFIAISIITPIYGITQHLTSR